MSIQPTNVDVQRIRTIAGSTMKDLIERLEKASGEDRELDGAIWWAVKKAQALRFFWKGSPGRPGPAPDALPEHGLGRHAVVHASPRYTASLDAALTLVPEDHVFTLIGSKSVSVRSFATCKTQQTFEHPQRGATPAIALVIAALKARNV